MNTLTDNQKNYLRDLTVEAFETFNEEAFNTSISKIEAEEDSKKAFNARIAYLQRSRKKREESMPVTDEFWTKAEEARNYFSSNPGKTELTLAEKREEVTQRQARVYYNEYISVSGQHQNRTPKMFGKLINLLKEKKGMNDEQAKACYAKLTFAQTQKMIEKLDGKSS